jgi:hypothetical protein
MGPAFKTSSLQGKNKQPKILVLFYWRTPLQNMNGVPAAENVLKSLLLG